MKAKVLRYIFLWSILILGLVVASCAQATEQEMTTEPLQPEQATSADTAEPLPEIGGTPTSTPEADPRNQLGASVWGAVFDDDTETWYQYDNDQASSEVRDGKLVLTAKKSNSFDSWTMSYPEMSDFYLEVLFTIGDSCEGKDRYGIFFRAPDNTQGYLYNVACDGSYQLRLWDGEQFTELINWTVDSHIAKGADVDQRLGVWAEGDQMALYVNGFQVGEAIDTTYSQGTFGVNIAGAQTAGFTVDVVEAKVWDLP